MLKVIMSFGNIDRSFDRYVSLIRFFSIQ